MVCIWFSLELSGRIRTQTFIESCSSTISCRLVSMVMKALCGTTACHIFVIVTDPVEEKTVRALKLASTARPTPCMYVNVFVSRSDLTSACVGLSLDTSQPENQPDCTRILAPNSHVVSICPALRAVQYSSYARCWTCTPKNKNRDVTSGNRIAYLSRVFITDCCSITITETPFLILLFYTSSSLLIRSTSLSRSARPFLTSNVRRFPNLV